MFFISCTTCNTRLKVRSAAAIGQILTCPRCGSMVLVEPPTEGVLTEAGVKDKPATGSAPEAISQSTVSSALHETSHDSTSDVTTSEHTSAVGEEFAHVSQLDQPDTSDHAPAEPTEPAVLPTDAWSGPATRQWQQWILTGGAALVGVAMAVALVGGYAYYAGRPSPTRLADTAGTRPQVPQSTEDAAGAFAETKDPANAPPRTASASGDAEQTGRSERQQERPSPQAELADESTSPEAQANAALSPRTAPSAEPPGLTDHQQGAELVSQSLADFNELASILEPPSYGSSMRVADAQDSSGSQASDLEASENYSPVPTIDVPQRLHDPISEIQFRDVPLPDFLEFLTQFSTIPMTLDSDALLRRGIGLQQTITVEQQDTTVEEVLMAAIEPLGLIHVVNPGQVLITEPGEPSLLRQFTYDVSDLANSDESAAALVQLIRDCVAPTSWQDERGLAALRLEQRQLVVQQTPAQGYRISVLLEKLRRARQLPSRLEVAEPFVNLQPRWSRAEAALDVPVKLNIFRPTPLLLVWDRIGEAADVQILVDWQMVASRGWHPQLPTTVSVDQPLRDVLEQLLEPAKLTYRVLDERTLEITSPKALRLQPDVELYAARLEVANGDAAAQLVGRLREAIAQPGEQPQSIGIALDAGSGSIVAVLSQTQHRALVQRMQQEIGSLAEPR